MAIIERAKEVKRAHKVASKVFSAALEGECSNYRDYLDLVFICRWLERVGNLSLNIAEDVVFEDTSTDIRHSGQVPDDA
jgi:phosphate transport system protein